MELGQEKWQKDILEVSRSDCVIPSRLTNTVQLLSKDSTSILPETWVPPNCRFEVDNALKKWEFKQSGHFDLIHLRDMFGSFADSQWDLLYSQPYANLAPPVGLSK